VTDTGELVGAGWRIAFFRAADRVAHRVELTAAGSCQPLLESVEGSPEEIWPASPALQQFHLQRGPDGRPLALLVGMSGRSHFSASVGLAGDGGSAVFEIACRAKSPPAALGTTYRVLGPQAVERSPAGVLIGPLTLGSEVTEPPPTWNASGQQLRLSVAAGDGAWPRTISWRYTLRFTPPA
jgi:hypothetical protein